MIRGLLYSLAVCVAANSCSLAAALELPELLLINPEQLSLLAEREDERTVSFRKSIVSRAAAVLETGAVYSVTDNAKIPPSGDKHDYYSTGPYWWPNPDTPNGLPYVARDGQFNPERDFVSDRAPLHSMIEDVRVVAVAYALTGNERFADWGSRLLRVWFLDEDTRMNPNLNHAQAIPGKTEGRGTGVIDTHPFVELVDAMLILKESCQLPEADYRALTKWFTAYATWLEISKNGRDERGAVNNHGTAYDMQYTSLLWFTEQNEKLKAYLNRISLDRIETQITAEGWQPLELKRTRTWSYCTENLEHFFKLGLIARKVEVDLFTHKSPTGSNLKDALDYLLPYVCDSDAWPHEQKTEWQDYFINSVLSIAAGIYDEGKYDEALDCLDEATNAAFVFLVRP